MVWISYIFSAMHVFYSSAEELMPRVIEDDKAEAFPENDEWRNFQGYRNSVALIIDRWRQEFPLNLSEEKKV